VTSSSSESGPSGDPGLDVALLKSWDFGGWRKRYGAGTQLPYRLDLLERSGVRLHWTDAVHEPRWMQSRPGAVVRRLEEAAVPFAQSLLLARWIAKSPVTLAMFESEANFVALSRHAQVRRPRSSLVVLTCWLGQILSTCSARRLAAYRWAYRSVDRLYYLSANQGPVLQERLDLPADRLLYLPFGVDIEGFAPTGEPDGDYVLVVGRDRGRDWPTLLDAVARLDMPVKLCCRPSDLGGLDVPSNVELLGYVDRDVYRALLGRARVVAVASKPVLYPSGQSVMLEAMAMARTVVVTATPAMAGYVEHGSNSLCVPPGDPSALSTAIATAAADDALRRRIGDDARRSVVASFSAQRMWTTVALDLVSLAGSPR
jgi:glycosyltransferase involved in cell wall biosynthesis